MGNSNEKLESGITLSPRIRIELTIVPIQGIVELYISSSVTERVHCELRTLRLRTFCLQACDLLKGIRCPWALLMKFDVVASTLNVH